MQMVQECGKRAQLKTNMRGTAEQFCSTGECAKENNSIENVRVCMLFKFKMQYLRRGIQTRLRFKN